MTIPCSGCNPLGLTRLSLCDPEVWHIPVTDIHGSHSSGLRCKGRCKDKFKKQDIIDQRKICSHNCIYAYIYFSVPLIANLREEFNLQFASVLPLAVLWEKRSKKVVCNNLTKSSKYDTLVGYKIGYQSIII